MVSSPLIKLIVLTVMSVHSLFGCSIHVVHAESCQMEESGCKEASCSREQKANGAHAMKQEDVCRCHSDQSPEVIGETGQQKSILSDPKRAGKMVSHKSPLVPPCQCACNGNHCVFVLDAVKPVLIDRFFLERANRELASGELLSQLLTHQLLPVERDLETGKRQVSRCAITQVWLI